MTLKEISGFLLLNCSNLVQNLGSSKEVGTGAWGRNINVTLLICA